MNRVATSEPDDAARCGATVAQVLERHYSRRPRKPSSVTAGIFLCVLPILCVLCVSCSMVSGKRRTDGSLVVTSWRLLWKSEAIEFSAGDTNFSATLRVGKSRSDEEAIKLAAEAAARAAVKSIVPIP